MIDIPQVAGVPPLIGNFAAALPTLLRQDLVSNYGETQPQWGLFKGGQPVIVFDTFLSIDYRQGWAIADYPLEDGAFQSYDKVYLPYDVRVRFASGGSLQNRRALLQSVKAIAPKLDVFQVITPEDVFRSVNVQHYDYRRTNSNGVGIIVVEMWLLEIRTTAKSSYVTSQTTSTTDATGASTDTTTGFGPPITSAVDESGFSAVYGGEVQPVPVEPNFENPSGPSLPSFSPGEGVGSAVSAG